MFIFVFSKNLKNIFIYTIIIVIFLLKNSNFAGTIIQNENGFMYKNDYGELAKDTWVWIDTNNDSIAECYRFDNNGNLLKNYSDRYGRETNLNGQLVENGEVIKKMLSSGEILIKKQTPLSGIIDFFGNIINPKKVGTEKGIKKELKQLETNGIDEGIVGQVIQNKYKNDIDILNGESADSGIIYSNARDTSDGESVGVNLENLNANSNDIVVGKDFRKFITDKNKCEEKVAEVYIYGENKWNDVLVLNGNGASVKFKLDNNNYIRFEVSHQTHGVDTRDTDITLDMYVDNILVDSFDEFVDNKKPQVIEEYLEGAKTVEIKVNIKSGATGRKVYIRNGRFKKVKIKDD